jgi:hypothetical protein
MVQAGRGVTVGLQCKMYRNSGNYSVPTWNEIPIVRDLTLNLEKGEAQVKARFSTWEQILPLLKSASIEFDILAETSSANDDHDTLRDAFIDDTVLDLAIAEGNIATSGYEYFRFDALLVKFGRGEPLEGVSTVSITAKHAYTTSQHTPAFAAGS